MVEQEAQSQNPHPDDVTIRQHGTWTETISHPAFMWTCNVCGWQGLECTSPTFAIQEAGRHWDEYHPELRRASVGLPGAEVES